MRGRVGPDVVERQLPGEQPGVGVEHRRRRLGDVEVADRRHREGDLVVAEGVRPDDGTVDAAVAALPDAAEAVDEVVVADVAPAAGLRVVRVDAAQQRGHLVRGVVVGVDRVVDEAGLHGAVARRRLLAHLLVGAPLGTRVDRTASAPSSSRSARRCPGAVVGLRPCRSPDACGWSRRRACLVDGVSLAVSIAGACLTIVPVPGSMTASFRSGGGAAVGGLGTHLHLVDVADHQGVGAGPLAGGLLLARCRRPGRGRRGTARGRPASTTRRSSRCGPGRRSGPRRTSTPCFQVTPTVA